jgi:cytochrome c oxidase subunit 4
VEQSHLETGAHEGLSPGRYALIYVALLVLTVATFSLSRLDLGIWSTVIALAIAVAKASLVALFFMQLWEHGGTYRLVLLTALLWVALMIVFILADVKTRFPLAVPSTDSELPVQQRPVAPAPGKPDPKPR